jgi:hypothetical protein
MSKDKSETDTEQKGKDTASSRRKESEHLLFIGAKRALIGGLIAGGVVLGGQFLVGRIYSGTEARRLMEAVVPSSRAVGTGVVGASATILALMLTMLSMSQSVTSRLGAIFYERVERIGLLSTIAMVSGVILLLMLNIPLQESKQLPSSWYTIVYYALIAVTAGVSGMLVAIVLMLYNAMQSLIKVLDLSGTAPVDKAPEKQPMHDEA